jgi:hypothetical protein
LQSKLINKNCGNTHMLYPSLFILSCQRHLNIKIVGTKIEKNIFFSIYRPNDFL